ncbi:MAG: hypothetical protein ABSB69_05990 [Solirubrobacteraceae bacterium]
MNRRLKKKLLLGVAIVAVLAGGTTAVVMAAQPAAHHRRSGTLATAAGYLGLSPAQLRRELKSGKSLADVANATSGKSSASLIEALEAAQKQKLAAAAAALPSRITAEVDRLRGRASGRIQTVHAATSYLGLSAIQLRAELRSGKTLAQIADATSGKSQAGLVEALVAARKATIAASVKAGTITQAQANALLRNLVSRVTARVERAAPKRRARKHPSLLGAGAP